MYERILIPLDGSENGEAALPVIEELISKLSAEIQTEIVLLQVISALTHWAVAGAATAPVQFSDKELKLIEQQARDYLTQMSTNLISQGVNVRTEIRFGNAAEEIIKAADELKVDLIAMSTHGRSGISRWTLGSIADRIIRGSQKPVLVIRAYKGK
jgi:nucleotide-binding universal stress UspA family protein